MRFGALRKSCGRSFHNFGASCEKLLLKWTLGFMDGRTIRRNLKEQFLGLERFVLTTDLYKERCGVK